MTSGEAEEEALPGAAERQLGPEQGAAVPRGGLAALDNGCGDIESKAVEQCATR
jgi:hypothetical protein